MEVKVLLIYHIISITLELGTKLIKGVIISHIDFIDEDINEKVMILNQAIEINKRVCNKSKGINESRIITIRDTKGVINGIL